jgi:hypothetical protein
MDIGPAYSTEAEFESYLRRLVLQHITVENPNIYTLDSKKAVDILICRDGPEPKLFFIEVKFHQLKHGRLGFGSRAGGGFQPEILSRLPAYFRQNLRWILASEAHNPGKVLFLDCQQVSGFVSGGAIGIKFNNFQPRIWRDANWLSIDQLVCELRRWLMN